MEAEKQGEQQGKTFAATAAAPNELVDDTTRRIRDTVDQRMSDYLDIWRSTARAWDRREFDAKHLLENMTALYTFALRDAATLYRLPFEPAPGDDARPSVISIAVPIEPLHNSVSIACDELRHVEQSDHMLQGHAVSISPNPVPAGATSVTVTFDSFGKPRGAYRGKLVTWAQDPGDAETVADVVVYVGGGNSRF
jgi:hypothetical protein